eukprot:COSAG04_NODE_30953_length_259_cov_1.287500_1_plen_59_part_00
MEVEIPTAKDEAHVLDGSAAAQSLCTGLAEALTPWLRHRRCHLGPGGTRVNGGRLLFN